MKIFDARFDIEYAYPDEDKDNTFIIGGNLVDVTGIYSTQDVNVGDIIYADGRILGFDLLRYKIIEINNDVRNFNNLVVTVIWDKIGEEAVQPCGGLDGIIGSVFDGTDISSITAYNYNSANEILVNKAMNYQMMLIVNEDKELNNKIKVLENNKTEVSNKTPSDKEVGHVWIEIM